MDVTFVSRNMIDLRIDKTNGKAFGKVLISYHRRNTPSHLEHEQIHVTHSFLATEPKWRIISSTIKAAEKKFLRLETAFPRTIESIFEV